MKDGAPALRSLASSRRAGKIVDLELTGKRVVVTGAGRGIGLAVTRGFVTEGAHVVAGSRTVSSELKELASEGSVTPVQVDLATSDGPARLSGGRRAAPRRTSMWPHPLRPSRRHRHEILSNVDDRSDPRGRE